ncbi:anthranilate synthase component I [Streptomyces sp. HSW2009]|uniref:anthranilate synthase component I n=1 Tax=Streptomyces sp. HSW2009 TaxID=3142890 RepID=UPI0032EC3D50
MTLLETAGSAAAQGAETIRWTTPAGVEVVRTTEYVGSAAATRTVLEDALCHRRGLLQFRDGDRAVGYLDPPVEVTASGAEVTFRALGPRGRVLLPVLGARLGGVPSLTDLSQDEDRVRVVGAPPGGLFAEEDRTRQVGVFAAVRALVDALAGPDPLLGLYGAFGYDLIFQVDPMEQHQRRTPGDRDLVLHLPDALYELDLHSDEAVRHHYEFRTPAGSTEGLERTTPTCPFAPGPPPARERDLEVGEYARVVDAAMPLFRSGALFEAVPGQVFHRSVSATPAQLFRRLRHRHPAPRSLLMNLADGEFLVGASPETFVRVRHTIGTEGTRTLVESTPISGTIRRGGNALEDAEHIRTLLNSAKDENELTMCTDVDRGDKYRVCVSGTVRVTARRRIEMYSSLIHTVDHVEGELRPGLDALDALATHLWAVTVTGAPKLAAVEFIARHERAPRRWYGGAVGRVGFDGGLDTALTLRTIEVRDGVATVRVGATLLHDSRPEDEEQETELKAKVLLDVLADSVDRPVARPHVRQAPGEGHRVLIVDHRDSFVHCLAGYFRETGAQVETYRSGGHLPLLAERRPDLVVLSPGPGAPADFATAATLAEAERLGIPAFGVCLGLQGLVEYFGGQLATLPTPVHGKRSRILRTTTDSLLLDGLPPAFEAGRYHSLYAVPEWLPEQLKVTATTEEGRVAMAVEAPERGFAAVQFHPESILSVAGRTGRTVIANAVTHLMRRTPQRAGR